MSGTIAHISTRGRGTEVELIHDETDVDESSSYRLDVTDASRATEVSPNWGRIHRSALRGIGVDSFGVSRESEDIAWRLNLALHLLMEPIELAQTFTKEPLEIAIDQIKLVVARASGSRCREIAEMNHGRVGVVERARALVQSQEMLATPHQSAVGAPASASAPPEWLSTAMRLESAGKVRAAFDVVFRSVDQMLRRGEFHKVDADLARADPNALSSNLIVATLTITAAARTRLNERVRFFGRARDSLSSRNELTNGLLDGLE